MLRINDRIAIPLEEFQWEFSRSGGPGGQNVNKVSSKVLLRWKPAASSSLPAPVRARLLTAVGPRLTNDGDLLITSQRTRDRARNVADCLSKLRELVLAAAQPPTIRRPTRPTHSSKLQRAVDKSRRSITKRLRRPPESD
jgi:ribosome-associated protein